MVLLGTLIGPDIVAAALGPLGGGIGGGVPKLGRLGAFCVALLRVVVYLNSTFRSSSLGGGRDLTSSSGGPPSPGSPPTPVSCVWVCGVWVSPSFDVGFVGIIGATAVALTSSSSIS